LAWIIDEVPVKGNARIAATKGCDEA
jgi:hypothetical protein